MNDKIADKKEEIKTSENEEKKYWRKNNSQKIIIGAIAVGLAIMLLVSFALGVAVGFKKAKFSYEWGKNYERNFLGSREGGPMMGGGLIPRPTGGMMREFEGRDFRNAHGIAGTIISITDDSLIIKDRDNKENTINVVEKTIIKLGRNDIKITDLKNNDEVVVMGKPGDNGVVNADLIRVFAKNVSN